MRPRKKGMELSLNFLVTIIIAITIFIFGLRFVYTLVSNATDLEETSIESLDIQIGSLLCGSGDRVCIPVDKKIIQKGKFDVFGVKIVNIYDARDFEINVERPSPSGYTKSNQAIESDKLIWKPKTRSVFIERNKEAEVGIGVEVPKSTASGTYIFDIKVLPYEDLHKMYVVVP